MADEKAEEAQNSDESGQSSNSNSGGENTKETTQPEGSNGSEQGSTGQATGSVEAPQGNPGLEIELTELAAEKVKEITAVEEMPDNVRLRVKVVGGGCAGFSYDLTFDEITEAEKVRPATADDSKSPMDRLLLIHGVYLIVDEMSLMYLRGTTVDYVETLQGAGFKFDNPNVKNTCGCGSSFS